MPVSFPTALSCIVSDSFDITFLRLLYQLSFSLDAPLDRDKRFSVELAATSCYAPVERIKLPPKGATHYDGFPSSGHTPIICGSAPL
jgi:hypothetical protein